MAFALIAGAGIAVGAYGIYQSGEESKKAAKLDKRALDMQNKNLEFSKQQYTDWKDTYGGLEENLANFYNNLTPDYLEAQGLQAQQQAYQQQKLQMDEFFASSGIESGAQADVMARLGIQNIREQSQIRADAPFKVAEQKSSFLSIGLNQKPGLANNVSNANTNISSLLTNQAAQARGNADQLSGYAADAIGAGTEAYIKSQKPKPKTVNQGSPTIQG